MTTGEDTRRGHEVLGHLMTANTGMGHAIVRMQAHEAEHGHLPPDELRVLAGLLQDVAAELIALAAQLDQPVIDV